MIVKHLYQRTIKKNGKQVKVWYYWYWLDGKQIRKSCGTVKKSEAQQFIANLKDEDLIPTKSKDVITFYDFCTGMFDEGSSYLTKLKNKNIVFSEETRKQKAKYLSIILERFGDNAVDSLNLGIIDDWLLRFPRSNSWRNNVVSVFKMIYRELCLYDLVLKTPEFYHYKRIDTKEKGILYPDEIKKLFPDNKEELISIWKIYKTETDIDAYVFATMIYTVLTTGMRNGEIRAITYSQFIRDDAILINAMLKYNDNTRIEHLKKGNDTNKKWRIAILPEKTVRMIREIKLMEGEKDSDYVFEYDGKPYGAEYINRRFQNVLKKNGIDWKERNITLHSLRFTYNTMMRREISPEDLRLMIGHTSAQMTDHYDKVRVLDQLPGLLTNKTIIDDVFN